MTGIVIVCNSRAERGPLESVIAALPEARVVVMSRDEQCGVPPWVMAKGLEYFADVLRGASLIILLGDRYETLAAALAATFLRIPIAHIHGGETTTGAFDDAFRHSITHMASLHFVATEKAARRVQELTGGARAYITGAPGLDGVPGNSAKRDRKLVLVTYHPETMAKDYGVAGCKALLEAIASTLLGYEVLFCGVNSDPGGRAIREAIREHCDRRGGRISDNLTHADYISLMQSAALVIGNSSAGVIEAPWVGVPSLDIGDRQLGRELAPSVHHYTAGDLNCAVDMAINWRGPWSPIYRGGAAEKIAAVCRDFVAEREKNHGN